MTEMGKIVFGSSGLNEREVPGMPGNPPGTGFARADQGFMIQKPETELKGGRTNYYLVQVAHPQREEQSPYQAECEDIIDALALTPDEANVFKEIWRSANARKGNGKPGHSALYGAQKMVHYSKRILRKREFEQQEQGK
jgi:hypothetical protein